ncbi:Clp protease N-terminal domain-containing protein [Actinophytocola sp.]|uniref:Clp protease N-terminal domain-containing protein n=1 Tax=Actinophytocola sp. TaxID=1872138 RepID=UPI002ED6507C
MPKVNVYLPDDLAETVKEIGLPVSAICQRALEQSVKRVSAIRTAVVGELDPTAGLASFTPKAKNVVNLAIEGAWDRGAEEVGTRDLLHAMISEGTNLGVHALRSIEVEPEQVLKELARRAGESGGTGARRVSRTAANALELTVIEALTLGHNYVGCEHLLLGLVAEPDGTAGQVLRGMGADSRAVRQAVSALLAGYLQATQAAGASPITAAVTQALEPVLRRLDRLEQRAGLTDHE